MIFERLENQLCLFSFEEILNASAVGFIVCSRGEASLHVDNPDCVFMNTAAQHFLGITDITNLKLQSVFGGEYRILNENRTLDFCADKAGRWYRVVKSFIDENHFLYTLSDISAEKQLETKFSYLQKLSAEAEETMEFGSWIWDIKNGHYEWTEGMYRLMGYRTENLPLPKIDSSSFKRNIHPDDVEIITGKLKNVLSYTDAYVLEFRIIADDGKEKHLYVRGHNTVDEKTGNIFSIGTAFNVSTLREIQGELEQKVHDLNTSNADLEQFAYIASHDLQEPLRKIVSFGERLENKIKVLLDEDSDLYLSRILSSTRRMQKMIDNLLEFSKVTSSSKIFEATDLNEILQLTLSDLEVTIQKKNAIIEIDNLPVIDANPTQISQLFINLISNSLKFTRPNINPVISLRVDYLTPSDVFKRKLLAEKSYIKIIVKDNGIGFSNDSTTRIFAIFQRLRGRSEYEGAGIGLSVCKKVVEGHSGSIEAFGVPDEGAVFEIILPTKQD